MEYVKGFSLKQQMDSNGVFQWQTACTVAFQMAKALQHVHEKGFIHGDVKPENIILSIAEKGNQPYAKLHDFGTSQTVEEALLFSPPVSESGIVEIAGTPEYMAPEQFKGASPDRRTDVYSLGKVLQAMLIGRGVAMSGRHRDSFVMNQPVKPTKSRFSKKPPSKECLRQISVPNMLKLLLISMLEEDANERPQSTDQVIDILQPLIRGVSRTPMTIINLQSSRKSDDQTIAYKSIKKGNNFNSL
jgi:serine/threonine-protein kinase